MAHPSQAAAERMAREQGIAAPAAPPAAALPPPPAAAPAPVPAPAPAPAPTVAAQADTTSPADDRRAQAEARKAEQVARKDALARDKAARRAERQKDKHPAPTVAGPVREPVFETPAAPAPSPAPVAAPMATLAPAPVDSTPVDAAAPSSGIIIFANTPGTHCGACETLKISVAPSGKVLIERGHWTGGNADWRYRKSVAHVPPARAAAFAARVNAYRPVGTSAGPACAATADDGVALEWIGADRHDRLTVTFACAGQPNSQMADALRHAPDLLGLRQLDFPWATAR
jgi:hypothetical protein